MTTHIFPAQLPNILTILRFILVIPFVYLILNPSVLNIVLGICVFIIASVSDYLDGYIARKYNLITEFGKFYDSLADKFFVISAFTVFSLKGIAYLPIFFVVILALRELYITLVRVKVKKAHDKAKTQFVTSTEGKNKMVVQIIAIALYLLYELLRLIPTIGIHPEWLLQLIPFTAFLIALILAYTSAYKYYTTYHAIAGHTLSEAIATSFYLGKIPKIPGTITSFVIACLVYITKPSLLVYFLFTVLVIIIGTIAAQKFESLLKIKDPAIITIDEVCGMLITLTPIIIASSNSIVLFAIGFIFYRILDGFKPLGIKKLQKVEGGIGIMVDDIVCATISSLLLFILLSFATL